VPIGFYQIFIKSQFKLGNFQADRQSWSVFTLAVGDWMFLGMQDFDFAQIKFSQI